MLSLHEIINKYECKKPLSQILLEGQVKDLTSKVEYLQLDQEKLKWKVLETDEKTN